MPAIGDYVAKIEGACGAEKDVIIVLKYEKKKEAIANILKRATVKSNLSGMIYDLTFEGLSFRVYSNGKAIFRSVKDRQELDRILAALLL